MTEEQSKRLKRMASVTRQHRTLFLDIADADAIDAAMKRIERLEGALQLIGSTLAFTREYGAVRSIIAKALEGRD